MNGQPITWDGPGEAMMGATIQDNNVVLYLCNDEDEYSIQRNPDRGVPDLGFYRVG